MTAPHEPVDQTPGFGENADAAPAAQDAAQAELDALRAQLDAAQATVNEQHDQLLRVQAEAENVRRRAQEEVSKARKFGIESFAESLVPVKDSLEAALAQADQTVDTLREGVEVTLKQLASALSAICSRKSRRPRATSSTRTCTRPFPRFPPSSPPIRWCNCCKRVTPSPTARCARPWWSCPPVKAERAARHDRSPF